MACKFKTPCGLCEIKSTAFGGVVKCDFVCHAEEPPTPEEILDGVQKSEKE